MIATKLLEKYLSNKAVSIHVAIMCHGIVLVNTKLQMIYVAMLWYMNFIGERAKRARHLQACTNGNDRLWYIYQ